MPDDDIAVMYTGQPGIKIAALSDPWLRDLVGADIDLEPYCKRASRACVCGPVPGALVCMNTSFGIRRCDRCRRFSNDLLAAQAVADHIGNGTTVWFEPAPLTTNNGVL